MTVKERIAALRARMKETGIDAYLIPTDDFHGSEYVGEYFKCRKYITGFTGSAGTAVIMQVMAGLWTDGRYFIQAANQLEGTGITLFKMGEPEVPTVHEFLKKNLTQGMHLTFAFAEDIRYAILDHTTLGGIYDPISCGVGESVGRAKRHPDPAGQR